ncbi:hypothetical protein EMIT0P176_310048 [Pseudomonas sp. IT-P176]
MYSSRIFLTRAIRRGVTHSYSGFGFSQVRPPNLRRDELARDGGVSGIIDVEWTGLIAA